MEKNVKFCRTGVFLIACADIFLIALFSNKVCKILYVLNDNVYLECMCTVTFTLTGIPLISFGRIIRNDLFSLDSAKHL